MIDSRNAIKIFYYLMSVDGKVTEEEIVKFKEIGREIDKGEFDDYQEDITEECRRQIEKAFDPEDYYDVIKEGVDKELEDTPLIFNFTNSFSCMSPKRLLIWNMLSIAFSDGEYSNEERKLIKYVVRKIDLDKVYFLEMEHLMKAAVAVEKELNWIKTQNRSYAEINEVVEELESRKETILKSAKEFIEEEE